MVVESNWLQDILFLKARIYEVAHTNLKHFVSVKFP